MSAATDPATVEEALRCGAHDYVIKPFRPERLRAALESYRSVKRKLKSAGRLSQAEVDRIRMWSTPTLHVGEEAPKGLNEVTLQQVTNHLSQQAEPQTAEGVAQALGMARVTARRYLDYLAKLGKVKLEMRYGGVGRPQNLYHLAKT